VSQTHFYYALNRKAAERAAELTWQQFLDEFGWGRRGGNWDNIGSFFEFGLDSLPQTYSPTHEDMAPLLRWKIRRTIPRMSPQYFMLLELSYQMRQRSFVKADIGAEGEEEDSMALIVSAIWGFVYGDIDARTLWGVFTLHGETPSGFLAEWQGGLNDAESRRIRALGRKFGRCRPLFDWQTRRAVTDGTSVLHEQDTKRFAKFLELAWSENWPVWSDENRLRRFRHFPLVRKLHAALPKLDGCCLVRYWGA
jgi:hypothetical protein